VFSGEGGIMTRIALCTLLAVLCLRPLRGQECGMSRAFVHPDGNAPGGQTAVWSDSAATALLFIEALNVNTDGTRRSYSVDDFWGERIALNNLCNAMNDTCAELANPDLRERRLLTQKAHAAGWPSDLLKHTRISADIIAFKDGKPCPDVDGFLVSATALHKPKINDGCDISNYVDALTVPALVLPRNPKVGVTGFAERDNKVGDLAVVVRSGDTTPVFAVVGDLGPHSQLGEASVALNGRLLGKTGPPKNYDEVRGRGEFKGQGWVVPRAIVLLFPKTRDADDPFMTTARIDEMAKRRFDEWGGLGRLTRCADAYARP
jgi:hypothetical protein